MFLFLFSQKGNVENILKLAQYVYEFTIHGIILLTGNWSVLQYVTVYNFFVPAETGECLSDIFFNFQSHACYKKHLKDIKNHSLYLTWK